jgi:hypothetical protein
MRAPRMTARAGQLLVGIASALLAGCSDPGEIPGFDALENQVKSERVGHAADHWIEMQNLAGEWERTGLIFGYANDYDECAKAIAGLRQVNDARHYRCVPAN